MATEGALAEAPPADLGDYARFISPTPTPTPSPTPQPDPTPELGDYAQFVSPAPSPAGGSPTPAPDLGDYSQFVSPTPHSDNVVAQTHRVADQVDESIAPPPADNFPDFSDPQVVSNLAKKYADAAVGEANQPVLSTPKAEIAPDDSIGVKANKAIYNSVSGLVDGATSDAGVTMLLNPLAGLAGIGGTAVDMIERYRDVVSKTPPYSPERVQFAADVGTFAALPMVGHVVGRFIHAEPAPLADHHRIQATDAMGAQIAASDKGLTFKGIQKTPEGMPDMLLFEDSAAGGTAANEGTTVGEFKTHLEEKRAKFSTPARGSEEAAAAILEANPVLSDSEFKPKMNKWSFLEASGIKKGLKPNSPELAQYIGARMQGGTGRIAKFDDATFYEKEDGRWVDNLDPEKEDLSFDNEAQLRQAESEMAPPEAAQPTPARGQARQLLDRYNSGDERMSTPRDLADALDGTEGLPPELQRAIDDYRTAIEEDRTQYGERSGLPEEAGDAFMQALERYAGQDNGTPSTKPATGAPDLSGLSEPELLKILTKSSDPVELKAAQNALKKISQPAIEGGETVPDAAPSDIVGGAAPPGPMSIGMASPEEFMQRYASVGASELLKGNTDPAGFANAVKAEFGSHINDLIPDIRARAEQLINDIQTATSKTDVSREVNRLVGVTKLIEQPERVRLFSALQDSLRRQEKAGEAGFKRGFKEASIIGNEKTRAMREKARTADAFLAADAQVVRDALIDYAKNLPLKERGKYLSAITSALRRTPVFSRDPAVMYRRAEAVLNRMTESLYNVEKAKVTEDIAKRLAKIEASPSVSVGQKQAARQIATTFNNLKDKMSFDMLERMHESIKQVEELGRDLKLLDDTVREAKTEAALTEIENQGTRHLDKPVPVKVPIGEERSYVQGQLDKLRAMPNFFRHFNLAWTPMDFVFQTFDQRLNGALYRTMKLPIDVKFSNFLDISHAYKERLSAIVKKNGLTDGQLNRITAVAELRQDGGLENLMSRGFTEPELKAIRLTKPELEYLREADSINAELLPKIRDVMAKEFNQEIDQNQGYWPRQRDWDYYDSLSITEGKYSQGMRKVQPEKGHTISRVEGAVTKNVLNAHEIMMKHLDDAVYHMVMGPEIRRVADIIKAPEFKDQVGTWGQKVFSDWLDVVARNGGIEGNRKIRVVDTVRKNVGLAQLAFRLTTTMLQPLSIIDGMAYVSPKEMSRSLTRVISKENRQWVLDNFPEIKDRVGDDPAYTDYKTSSVRDAMARVGFKGIGFLDRFAALTVADGAYRDYLNMNGIKFDPKNINADAVHYAQQIVRKSQSTALPKDIPLAISRGAFSGNASVDKAIGQFQNFMIRRWASIKNDGLQMGIKDKSIKAGARIMGFTILATVAEQLGREGIKAMVRATIGESSRDKNRREKDPPLAQKIPQNAAFDFMTSIPIVSNLVGAIRYEGTGIPALDVAGKAYKGINQMATGASATSKAVGAIKTGQAAGALVGIPTGQAGDLLIKWIQSGEAASKKTTVSIKKPKAKKSR